MNGFGVDEDPLSERSTREVQYQAIFSNFHHFLSSRQRTIVDEIKKKDSRTADFFVAALVILNDKSNPVKETMAAISYRNLMEHLPKKFDFAAPEIKKDVHDQVVVLIKAWEAEFDDSGIQKVISQQPPLFIEKFATFRGEFKAGLEIKDKRHRIIIENLKSEGSLPSETVINAKISTWKKCYRYFSKLVHGDSEAEPSEIFQYAMHLENLLADSLINSTFDNFDAIDTLVEKLEAKNG